MNAGYVVDAVDAWNAVAAKDAVDAVQSGDAGDSGTGNEEENGDYLKAALQRCYTGGAVGTAYFGRNVTRVGQRELEYGSARPRCAYLYM